MRNPFDRKQNKGSGRPARLETIPCTPEHECIVCTGKRHPCRYSPSEAWCGYIGLDEIEEHTPDGWRWIETIPGSNQQVFQSIALAAATKKNIEDPKLEPATLEADTPEGRRQMSDRIVAELKRIEAIEDPAAKELERFLLSKREGVPQRELTAIDRATKANQGLAVRMVHDICREPDLDQTWLIENMVELGTSTIIASEAKTGKTPLAYDLGYSVATSEPWLEHFKVTDPGGVLILQSDESVRASKKNFRRRGLHHCQNVAFSDQFSIEQIPALQKEIQKLKKAIGLKLVIVDSLSSINKNSTYSENDSEYARDLYALTMLAAQEGVAIVIIHHRNKAPMRSGLGILAGSGRIPAAVDDIWSFSRMDATEDPSGLKRVLERLGGHDGDLFKYVLGFQIEDRGWTFEGVYDPQAEGSDRILRGAPEVESLPVATRDRIRDFVSTDDRVWGYQDLSEHLGINANTARKCLNLLADGGWIEKRMVSTTHKGRHSSVYYKKEFSAEVETSGSNCPISANLVTASLSKNGQFDPLAELETGGSKCPPFANSDTASLSKNGHFDPPIDPPEKVFENAPIAIENVLNNSLSEIDESGTVTVFATRPAEAALSPPTEDCEVLIKGEWVLGTYIRSTDRMRLSPISRALESAHKVLTKAGNVEVTDSEIRRFNVDE